MATKLSHYNRSGKSKMVDVSGKSPTPREAEASAFIVMRAEVWRFNGVLGPDLRRS